jgi:membrane protease YdiL (CAAX protease family)
VSAPAPQDALDAGARALVEDPAGAGTALVLLLGALALVPAAVALVRRFTPRVPVFFARWRFTQLGLVFAAGVAFLVACSSALVALAPGADRDLMAVFGGCLGLGLTCALIAWIARRMDPSGVRSLGLWPGGHLRAASVGALAYLLCLPTLVALALLWPWLHERLGGEAAEQPFFDLLARTDGWTLVGLVAVLVAVQPLFEELIFRSFLQPLLVQNLGDRGGVALTSLGFALLHGAPFFLPIFALSLLLGALKLRTQRLAACWAVHALHNGLMVGTALLAGDVAGGAP